MEEVQTNYQEDLKNIVDRLEKANEIKAELLTREENLTAKRIIGGQTGQPVQEPKPKEDTPREYADKLRGGKIVFTN